MITIKIISINVKGVNRDQKWEDLIVAQEWDKMREETQQEMGSKIIPLQFIE